MKLIFGRKLCSECQEAKRALEADGIEFRYIDVDDLDRDDLALAAYHEVLKEKAVLPIIVDEEE